MSGPVPSPSMKGMIGLFGTLSLPPSRVMAAPFFGGVRFLKVGFMGKLLGDLGASRVDADGAVYIGASMTPDRDALPHRGGKRSVDVGDGDAGAIAALGDDGPPRVDDHRVPKG